MSPTEVGGIVVAVIAALGAWASQRAAAKASSFGTRMDAEKEAYERARKFDIETIERQEQEIEDLRREVKDLKHRLAQLEDRTPIAILGLEGILRDRAREDHGSDDSKQQDV